MPVRRHVRMRRETSELARVCHKVRGKRERGAMAMARLRQCGAMKIVNPQAERETAPIVEWGLTDGTPTKTMARYDVAASAQKAEGQEREAPSNRPLK